MKLQILQSMNNFIKIFIFFTVTFITTSSYASRPFQFISIRDLMQKYPDIKYQKCLDPVSFHYEPFTILPAYANQGTFLECFILTIPKGILKTQNGYVFVDNYFIKELIWADQPQLIGYNQNLLKTFKIPGRIAVITQLCFTSYSHWLNEILGRLALLEMQGVAYDWLYVPYLLPYSKETLELWGIDHAKIISPNNYHVCLQTEQLIVPSLVINTDIGFKKHIGLYTHPQTSQYVRNKLLNAALQRSVKANFSKKVFISRKDSSRRKMINEDELFVSLKAYGFERYELSKMSVIDQILLFHNAEIVIAEHGTGLVNIMFCKPGTRIIEIFQSVIDSSFWYMAQMFHLNYQPIKTIEFEEKYMTNPSLFMDKYMMLLKTDTYLSPENIIDLVKNL